MAYSRKFQSEQTGTPFCQVTGCFQNAAFYVVVKETEEPDYHGMPDEKDRISKMTNSTNNLGKQSESDVHFDGFKMIMYFCARHENDFKYLINGSELRISKACLLRRILRNDTLGR